MNLPRSGAFFLLAALAAVPVWAGDAATIKAGAGLDGLCRPGRWAPVRVEVDYRGADTTGEIAVEWGDARVRRAISLASHSRKQFELYIRTPDARDSITVRLLAAGREIGAIETPVRLIAPADPLTVCVANGDAARSGIECTATMNAAALPRSWRGYAAADDVVWGPDGSSLLSGEQQTALKQWRAVQTIENADVSTPSIGEGAPSTHALRRTSTAILLYAAALGVCVLPFSGIRRRSLVIYPALVALLSVGTAVAIASGHVGPGAVVHVAQAAIVQQLPGAKGSLIVVKGIVEFPSLGVMEMRAAHADGALAMRGGKDGRELRFDENGAPIVTGTFALGSTARFELEAVTPFEALHATSTDAMVRISNISTRPLHDCRFGDGFSKSSVGSLAPGQSVDATRQPGPGDDLFTCRLDAPVVDFAETRLPVAGDGTAVIVIRLAKERGRP